MKKLLILLFAAVNILSATQSAHSQTAEVTVFVNAQHPQASDSNPGTETLPFKTIRKAVAVVLENNWQRKGTKVRIAPGVYRESISVPPDWRETDAAMTFEATEIGKVIVSGSDVWTGWTRQGTSAIYARAWPYKWGLAPYPPYWEGNVVLQPIVRRREMIFLNGTLLDQVLSVAELKPGSFTVDETLGTVQLMPPVGANMDTAVIEVAVRAGLLKVTTKHNVTIRGLTFTHDNTPLQGSAVTIESGSNIVLEDNQFLWNNWGGLSLLEVSGGTLRRNVASHNGVVGMDAWKVKNLVAEDNDTSYNNWRGAKGGFYGWAATGMKIMLTHGGSFRRHRSVGNQTRGLWFDTDCTDIVVEDSFLGENLQDGVFLEALQGPITVRNSTICHNQKGGILIANSANVALEKNIVYGNRDAQVLLSGEYSGARGFTNWETGLKLQVVSEGWTVKSNAVVGLDSGFMLLSTTLSATMWDRFVATLTSDSNVWFNPNDTNVFRIAGSRTLDFSAWRSTTGRDSYSTFADPLFRDPVNHDFRPQPGSPLFSIGGWPGIPSGPQALQIQ